jgi:hypothetical protein
MAKRAHPAERHLRLDNANHPPQHHPRLIDTLFFTPVYFYKIGRRQLDTLNSVATMMTRGKPP